MRVCLFEDRQAADPQPPYLARSASDLLAGGVSLAERQLRAFTPREVGAIVRPHLSALTQAAHPTWHVNDLAWLRSGRVILVNARWLPAASPTLPAYPCVGLLDGEVAYAVVTPAELLECSPFTMDHYLDRWRATLPTHEAGGRFVRHPGDLAGNGAAAGRDVA